MHEYILNDVAQVYSRKSDELEMIKCDVCGKQWNGKRKYVSNNNEFPVILLRLLNVTIFNSHIFQYISACYA